MTTEQLSLLFRVGREPNGLVAEDSDLPVAESLRAEGVLDRHMIDGEAIYVASETFEAKAVRLIEHQADASDQAYLN